MVDATTIVWLSDVGDEDDIQLGSEAQILRTERLFDEIGDCEPGDQVGLVYIVETSAHGNRVLVTATFELENGDGFVAAGAVERIEHHGRPSFRGRLGIGGGTGKFKGWRGQVDVDVCNPKHWIVSSGS
jgi:hypothetical protein